MERPVDHRLYGFGSAECLSRLGVPGGALLAKCAGFVLGIPGFQGGLLSQMQRLHWRRWPAMIMLKLDR